MKMIEIKNINELDSIIESKLNELSYDELTMQIKYNGILLQLKLSDGCQDIHDYYTIEIFRSDIEYDETIISDCVHCDDKWFIEFIKEIKGQVEYITNIEFNTHWQKEIHNNNIRIQELLDRNAIINEKLFKK